MISIKPTPLSPMVRLEPLLQMAKIKSHDSNCNMLRKKPLSVLQMLIRLKKE
jgi:hypothetical protein